MKISNSILKALTALMGVAFMLLIAFTGCKQTGTGGGDGDKPKPKHAITFSVDSMTPDGELTAKADGTPETDKSPINDVEEGKTITFTATPEATYRVKEWKVDGKVVENNKTNTYTHTVTKPATITVSFEEIPKHKITFSVEGTQPNGTLKAKVGEDEINSGKKVEEGTTITFTATANENYQVKEWKVGDTVVENNKTNTYTHIVTKPCTITVSFEVTSVEGGAVLLSPISRLIKLTAKTADDCDITVEGCEETTLKSNRETILRATGTKVVLKGKITELNCSGEYGYKQSLTALNVQGCTTLQELKCKYNKLHELNVQGCTSLQKLDCYDNQLTSLNVQGLTALQELKCGNNQIHELSVQSCTSLQQLNCYDNQLTSLDVQGLTRLQYIFCSKNQLTSLNVQGCTRLQKLECTNNQLTSLDVQGLTKLQELYCSNNQLTSLNVQGCTKLQKLECSDNQLSTLNVHGLTKLQYLRCYANKLNAEVFTKLLNDLPQREAEDKAQAILYTTDTSKTEGNCKVFTNPPELKAAFEGAKKVKHWALKESKDDFYYYDI